MSNSIVKEAGRIVRICNACRYCEGFCAVFPAMELNRVHSEADLKYLANLCHNCRGCYYACQYAPPHEFDLNFPRTMAKLRQATYKEASWPAGLGRLFDEGAWVVVLTSLFSISLMWLTALWFRGGDTITARHSGPGAFYQVIPYWAMILPMGALAVGALYSMIKGGCNLWRIMGGKAGHFFHLKAQLHAIWDVLRLKYLDGGGHGCNYPDDRFSMIRRNFHHAVFYGFGFCFISTSIAAVYDHVFHLPAPYALLSWPVVFGTLGGLALCVGTGGLFYLKLRMDPLPAAFATGGMDMAFITLLFLTGFTGLLLLLFRSTGAMGTLLIIHLGLVMAFFLNLAYGKFIHSAYRYVALVKNAKEQMDA